MIQRVPRILFQSFRRILQNRGKNKYITLLKRLLNKNQKRIGKLHDNWGKRKKECFRLIILCLSNHKIKMHCPPAEAARAHRDDRVLLLSLDTHVIHAEYAADSFSVTSQGQPLQVRSAQREEVREPGFPSLPCSLRCLCGRLGNQLSRAAWGNAASLFWPLKMISTEQVTAPPSFLRTIVSWVHGSLVLWLLPPHCWGLMSEVVWQWVLVSHGVFFFDRPENASECAARRWPRRSSGSVSKAEWSGHLPSGK